jgi:5-methylcytosine-specific restriction protein A
VKRYDEARGTAAERGYDTEWQQLRAAHLRKHPWCADGCGKRATDVDHRVSVRVAPHRRLDPTNLVSYAHGCHSRKTVREDGGFGRTRGDGPHGGAAKLRPGA